MSLLLSPAALPSLSVWTVLTHTWTLQLLLVFAPVLAATAVGPIFPIALAAPPHSLTVQQVGLVLSARSAAGVAVAALNGSIAACIGSLGQALLGLTVQVAGVLLFGLPNTALAIAGLVTLACSTSSIIYAHWPLILEQLRASGLPVERCRGA